MKRNSNVKYAQNPPCFSKVLIREPCLEHYYTLEKKKSFLGDLELLRTPDG